ncbi:MAG: 23S rRNA (guanosine(2251)-2'-O)-methyltransferase RlmB [Acidobacteriia bacterium]|nr:23S rRNA (guanosine(2251)-2'-O)-methyltransferase RlmB [Terriglobia bacterium]
MVKRESNSETGAVYGINAVAEAVRAQHVEHVMITQGQHSRRVQEIIDACRKAGISVRFAPRAALDRAAGTAHHQDIVAVCPTRRYDDLESLLHVREKPLLVVLDGVEDPRNLGAVVRTAVAAGADGLVIPERRAAGLTSTVAHAAAGALEHLKVARVTNLVRSLLELKEHGLWVYGFEAAGPKSYLELDYCGGCVLVLGGEGRGLHRLVREACDLVAQIPLYGPVQSLNVSVAAAVVLYEAARQRQRAADSRHHTGGGGTAAR